MRRSQRALAGTLAIAAAVSACQLLVGVGEPLPGPSAGDSGTPGASSSSSGAAEAGPVPTDAYARAVLADGPVLYLRFSEATGSRVADLSGAGGDLFLSGAFQRGRPGLIAGADTSVGLGNGAQLSIPARFDFALDASFTYELWVRLDKRGEVLSNLEGAPPNLRGSALYLSDTRPEVGFERWSQSLLRSAHQLGPLTPGPRGAFHLVVVNGPDRPVVYVNGVREAGGRNPGPALTPAALVVGNAPGDYDEIAVYDKALSDERIIAHYGVGRGD